ncbi:MAG: hypothetical protein ACXVMS_13770 [Flavisolibacter sp.]
METPVPNRSNEVALEEDGSFVVRENKTLNTIVAAFFYLLFFYAVFNTCLSSSAQGIVYDKMLLVVLVPAILFTFKAFSKRVYILINKEGIYINNFLLTDWKNFVSAEYKQKEIVGSIQDKFVLFIEYYRDGMGYYVKEVPLTNSQNKSEEEVIAAIEYFYELSKLSNQV